jgi:hypothetical protein
VFPCCFAMAAVPRPTAAVPRPSSVPLLQSAAQVKREELSEGELGEDQAMAFSTRAITIVTYGRDTAGGLRFEQVAVEPPHTSTTLLCQALCNRVQHQEPMHAIRLRAPSSFSTWPWCTKNAGMHVF